MIVLNDEQVAFILEDIRRNGIETEDLQYSLLDHICCVVENEMSPESKFDEFYRSVLPRFFKKELREIQEETSLLLTFKQYYAMKKVMLYSGTFSAISFIIGAIFKIMHWPGAAVILLIAIASFSFIFLPILFLIKSKESKAVKNKSVLAVATIFGSLISLATLFKIMHWPGANIMWLSSLGILFFIFLPIYFFGGIRNAETKFNTIISSILIITAGGLLFTLTSLRSSKWTEDASLRSETELLESYEFLSEKSHAVKSRLNDSLNIANQLLYKSEALCKYIENTKMLLLNGVGKGQLKESEILRSEGGNVSISRNLLFNKDGSPGKDLLTIKESLNDLRIFIDDHYEIDADKLLDTEPVSRNNESVTWEQANFDHLSLQHVIHNLNQLLLNIRIVESTALKA